MPDISMCLGEGCKKRKECYRFTASPSDVQTYFLGVPHGPGEPCEYFWPTTEQRPRPKARKPSR